MIEKEGRGLYCRMEGLVLQVVTPCAQKFV